MRSPGPNADRAAQGPGARRNVPRRDRPVLPAGHADDLARSAAHFIQVPTAIFMISAQQFGAHVFLAAARHRSGLGCRLQRRVRRPLGRATAGRALKYFETDNHYIAWHPISDQFELVELISLSTRPVMQFIPPDRPQMCRGMALDQRYIARITADINEAVCILQYNGPPANLGAKRPRTAGNRARRVSE